MYKKSVMRVLSAVVLFNKPITFLTSSLPLLSPLLRHSAPPLFFDQTEARGAEKFLLETAPPPALSKGLDDRFPPYREILTFSSKMFS